MHRRTEGRNSGTPGKENEREPWHLYRFDKDLRADAILYAVIEAILGEKAADITDVPWELRCVWEGGKRANVFE